MSTTNFWPFGGTPNSANGVLKFFHAREAFSVGGMDRGNKTSFSMPLVSSDSFTPWDPARASRSGDIGMWSSRKREAATEIQAEETTPESNETEKVCDEMTCCGSNNQRDDNDMLHAITQHIAL